MRASGLNIMMSMKSEGKPVSFIEDCAVPLEHLADYTERLTAIFEKHGTKGTWYAHASVGCLHVRPVLNLKLEKDARTMRAIAEEAFALVKAYKGSHSGEHGDGLVRSEFHEKMYGAKTVRLFEEVKDRFDPQGVLNPGKIVRASADGRPHAVPLQAGLSACRRWGWRSTGRPIPGAGGGFQGAVEMCNNNGECRKTAGGVMCPSFRITGNERDVTRGRANALRLAISGQLGPEAFASDDMLETMKLCVSCKGCRRECPTGVDMAKMKIEVLAAANARRGLSLRDRLVAYLPRYAPYAAYAAPLLNARDAIPGLPRLGEWLTGLSAQRALPHWRRDRFRAPAVDVSRDPARDASDTSREGPQYHARDGAAAGSVAHARWRCWPTRSTPLSSPRTCTTALALLAGLGYRVSVLAPREKGRALCCGRTFLSAGLVAEARAEARRLLAAALPFVARGVPIVGLEPSCLFTLRDELPSMLPGSETGRLASHALLLEEFLVREADARRIPRHIARSAAQRAAARPLPPEGVRRHAVPSRLRWGWWRALRVETVESSCCGMAGAFGYGADTYEASMAMGELALLPAVRKAAPGTIIAADGFSCRHQIRDGSGREAWHVARILHQALGEAPVPADAPAPGR